jgi:hypothetical protein
LLATGAAAALALAAVGLRAAAGSALGDNGSNAGIALLLAAAFAIGALITATKYRTHVRSAEVRATAVDRLRNATVAAVFAAAVLVPFALLVTHLGAATGNEEPRPFPTPSKRTFTSGKNPATAAAIPPKPGGLHLDLGPLLLIVGLAAAAAVLAAAIVLALRLLRSAPPQEVLAGQPPPLEVGQDDQTLADALRAGRSALQGDDARAAIIACYAAMEDSLAAAGVARERADSPSDLLRRATARDAVDAPAATALTDLFREARFSTHPMDAGRLSAARSALETITASVTGATARPADAEEAAAAR